MRRMDAEMSTTNADGVGVGSSDYYGPLSRRLAAGERLSGEEIAQLAATPDILAVGMLADEHRRRMHAARVTFVRVANCPFDRAFSEAVPPTAAEIRLTGVPQSVDAMLAAVQTGKSVAGDRLLSGFSLTDLAALAASSALPLRELLEQLRQTGLEMVAEVPVDKAVDTALDALFETGFTLVRLTVDRAVAADRINILMRSATIQQRFKTVHAISPLPTVLNALRPTTGYDDVKNVALARLIAPDIPTVQVDWLRYGPKLAQVALTFGADDVDNVSTSDDAPEGRRRAPLDEVRRNIEAAGFTPAKRDGRFVVSG
jgi:aminodeoxyfutalosine synthase